jgi:hypothetical protein
MADIDAEFRVFRHLVNDKMRFLIEKFGFREAEANCFDPGMWVFFRNATTEVGVQFEFCSGLWVSIAKLDADGNPASGYALGHLLMVRAPELARPTTPVDFDQEAVASALDAQAILLKEYASDVLEGDFSIFPELTKIRDAMLSKREADSFKR